MRTGRVLDLRITTPDRYAGVDHSQAMLNQLVRKHPTVAAAYPMRIEHAIADKVFTPRQFEIVAALSAVPATSISTRSRCSLISPVAGS